ncbi:MAG: hypothetical protein R3258_08225 [Acidimicrobiia bacterium]|nr:hypothetical protein [Acidimicrobiia bacterium]
MSPNLDGQLRQYCIEMDEAQGVLSFDDIMEKAGELPTIRKVQHSDSSERRRWVIAMAGIGAVVFAVVVGLGLLSPAPDVAQPGTTTTTTAPPRTDYPESGPVEAGTYRLEPSASTVAAVILTMPEGWITQDGLPMANKAPNEDAGFAFYTVGRISSDPCERAGGVAVGSFDALAEALVDLPDISSTGPVDTTLGGLPAQRVDLTVAAGFDASSCNAPGGLQIWYSELAGNYFVLLDDHTASVYIIEVAGQRQVYVTSVRNGATEQAIAELRSITESIHFDQ